MKIIVATYGTEGDARPFAALCRGLIDAGHEARLLADAATLGSARALGVPTTALAGDIRGALAADRNVGGVVAKGGGFNATARALATIANANAESWLSTIVEIGEGCDAVLGAGLAAFAGFSAAEVLGAKAIGAGMIPITPTAAFASPFLPPKWIPSWLNRPSHVFVNAMLWKAFRNKTRLAAANVRLCGPAWLARRADWAPPPALANFLAAGDAPIYIGFGSMTGFDQRRLMDALIGALAGRRALFHAGWSGFDPKALPGNVFAIGDTPHDWLFPRTAAVIHHGGSGTRTPPRARARRRSSTPFAGDQFFGPSACASPASRRPPSMAGGQPPRRSPAPSTSPPRPKCGARPDLGRGDARGGRRREWGGGPRTHRRWVRRRARRHAASRRRAHARQWRKRTRSWPAAQA